MSEKERVEAIMLEQQEKMKSLQEETRASLQAVLTQEQMDKLERKMSQRKKR